MTRPNRDDDKYWQKSRCMDIELYIDDLLSYIEWLEDTLNIPTGGELSNSQ